MQAFNLRGGLVDTHRHLGGSCSPKFLLHAMDVGACPGLPYDQIERHLVCLPDEPREFNHFLSKFKFLDKILWTEELVAAKIKYVCNEMNNESLEGVFLDFSVSKYRHIGWSLTEAMNFILDRLDEYSDIPIIPILSIKYESPREAQLKIAQVIDDSSIADRVGGIDFVGDESKFNPSIQRPICQMWDNKLVRLHVGESQHSQNVNQAITDFKATNIAHGIKIVDDKYLLEACGASQDVIFDIAPTSNYVTGVVKDTHKHPSKIMMEHGVHMTVGSDDPIQCSTTLHQEYTLLSQSGFTEEELDTLANNGRVQLAKWLDYSVGGKDENNFGDGVVRPSGL